MVRCNSIYDPFVFLAPFVLKAKLILQELCKLHLGWDDKIPDELANHWNHCHQDLLKLKDFKVSRCFKPPSFKLISVQLHHYADASETGYSMVSCLRLENAFQEHHCSLITRKSLVVPLKKTTIPRLELTAVTLAVRTNRCN